MSADSTPHTAPLDIARSIVDDQFDVSDGPRLMTLGDQERMSAELVSLFEQLEAAQKAMRKAHYRIESTNLREKDRHWAAEPLLPFVEESSPASSPGGAVTPAGSQGSNQDKGPT